MVNWHNTRPPKLKEEDEITSVFEMVVNETYALGFHFCAFKMSTQHTTNQNLVFEKNNYPNEWNKLYRRAKFFHYDPVVTHCQRSVLPFVWKESAFEGSPHLWQLARSYGVHLGWTQPLHSPHGVVSMLTLSRRTGEITPEELYEKAGNALWLCHALHTVVAHKYANGPTARPSTKLTAREIEVLRWSALGKTAAEIAQILCLSERTVGFHNCSSMRKLGVNNKIAAVMVAAKAGFL
ncbi:MULTISPECIES: helix-turn-helix transcriptional regulator [Pseudomonas]|jgi:LuxR family transcriptional regulator|uniref:LuxR family transcriptional regulator n=1 Tax=Pseudomonas quebecensis TaxID=2995174 RepID=A0ABY6QIV2_9PSED|nr:MULTISPECIES: LuxR family transcriptional regulator [Pseudomonas]MCP1512927.1 LuxR family transcriptional regulator [Pseudomonas rhodesiae]MCX4064880.1 LuxR family transcriptional regulator [Pseudomonas quebecensis]MDF9771786.1 LuxR family transcriptional regulator [Pseudomonas rhodesiae]UZW19277.1 LuxR family transcriptional regulator [Pseudomonas quebecensis]UZW23308.1 LuxR family transcriptional regulator [Pseudomonas quebecensis]